MAEPTRRAGLVSQSVLPAMDFTEMATQLPVGVEVLKTHTHTPCLSLLVYGPSPSHTVDKRVGPPCTSCCSHWCGPSTEGTRAYIHWCCVPRHTSVSNVPTVPSPTPAKLAPGGRARYPAIAPPPTSPNRAGAYVGPYATGPAAATGERTVVQPVSACKITTVVGGQSHANGKENTIAFTQFPHHLSATSPATRGRLPNHPRAMAGARPFPHIPSGPSPGWATG